MKSADERIFIDEWEIRESSVESISENERIELKETNERIRKIREETLKITHVTSDRIFNEVYFG